MLFLSFFCSLHFDGCTYSCVLEKQGERKKRHKLSQKTAATVKSLGNTIAFLCAFYGLHLSLLSMNNLNSI